MAVTATFTGNPTTFTRTMALSDSTPQHVEAARQAAHAVVLQQAYPMLQKAGTVQMVVGETLQLPTPLKGGGSSPGSITRTLTITPA